MADGTNQRGPGSSAPLPPEHDPATALTVHAPRRAAAPGASSSPGASGIHGRFEPGTRLGERYRIVGLLGRGGMGKVYRADDLELAGLDPSAFRPVPPASAPPNYCDEVAAWEGEVPGDPTWPVRWSSVQHAHLLDHGHLPPGQ